LFHAIQASYKLPNQKTLFTTLLEKELLLQNFKVENTIAELTFFSIQCDGWCNLRQKEIIYFVITTPEFFFLMNFIHTDGKSHTAEYLTIQIIIVINKYDSKKFVAFINDNSSDIVKDKMNNKFKINLNIC